MTTVPVPPQHSSPLARLPASDPPSSYRVELGRLAHADVARPQTALVWLPSHERWAHRPWRPSPVQRAARWLIHVAAPGTDSASTIPGPNWARVIAAATSALSLALGLAFMLGYTLAPAMPNHAQWVSMPSHRAGMPPEAGAHGPQPASRNVEVRADAVASVAASEGVAAGPGTAVANAATTLRQLARTPRSAHMPSPVSSLHVTQRTQGTDVTQASQDADVTQATADPGTSAEASSDRVTGGAVQPFAVFDRFRFGLPQAAHSASTTQHGRTAAPALSPVMTLPARRPVAAEDRSARWTAASTVVFDDGEDASAFPFFRAAPSLRASPPIPAVDSLESSGGTPLTRAGPTSAGATASVVLPGDGSGPSTSQPHNRHEPTALAVLPSGALAGDAAPRRGPAQAPRRGMDRLVAILDSETILVPGQRGHPEPMRIGAQLPGGALLLSIDVKRREAHTTRGVLGLE